MAQALDEHDGIIGRRLIVIGTLCHIGVGVYFFKLRMICSLIELFIFGEEDIEAKKRIATPVSYTHLELPTNSRV